MNYVIVKFDTKTKVPGITPKKVEKEELLLGTHTHTHTWVNRHLRQSRLKGPKHFRFAIPAREHSAALP